MIERIGILGCGYVGLELLEQLPEGLDVYGVRRSETGLQAVEAAGARAVRADLTDPDDVASLPDADALVYAASTGGNGSAREVYIDGLQTVIEEFGARETTPERLLYTSSTGVYGDHDGDWVDEGTPIDPSTERQTVLREAERLALDRAPEVGIDGTVVRFAGLYGPDRYRMDRYLDGPVTAGWLNLIHRADAAGVLRYLIEADRLRNDLLLAVDDEPLDKWSFADWLAEQVGVPAPPKRTVAERLESLEDSSRRHRVTANKRCSNAKLAGLGYEYAFPTAEEGYQPAIEAYRTE